MDFLSRIVRYLFWVVVVVWGIRLLRWLFGHALGDAGHSSAQTETPNAETQGRRLVRDPVCGMHVAEVLAIPVREGAETVHFCSTQCRDKYEASLRKCAAHG
jgi:YHS domain-containing protein